MKTHRTVLHIVLMVGLASCAWAFRSVWLTSPEPVMPSSQQVATPLRDEVLPMAAPSPVPANQEVHQSLPPVSHTWPDVPFISQAPTGDWSRSEFQNGCEEASVLMIAAWRSGKKYTHEEAKKELVALARFEEARIGQGVDTDAADTAKLLLGSYFNVTDYSIEYDFSLTELQQALATGPIIVPTNGRALGNPNYTPPGPLQHMVVITGYDGAAHEFITHDPGTRRGAGYRYPEDILYAAIREYPTGKHGPIRTERKAMIVIPSVNY